jgi:hypothetical protein
MHRPRTSRAARRGVTLIEAGLVGSAATAVIAGLALWFGPKSRAADQDQAQRDAAVILEAAESWQKANKKANALAMGQRPFATRPWLRSRYAVALSLKSRPW